MFQDEGGYGDNSGSLSIEIWERGNSDQETETNNYSLSFDGQDDYVYFGNILDVGTYSFSYGMWLKLRNLNASWQQNIMSKARSQGGYKFDVQPNTNYLRANFEVAGTDQYISAYSDPIEEDKWYYATVVVNRDSNNMKIYLDGNLQSSVDIYDQSYDITNTGTFRLAHNHWNNHPNSHEGPKAEFMDGQLSNFSFWGKPLYKVAINNIMHSELTGSEQDLLGYWKLDEGNGSSILDLTSSSNHGQISGASWVEDVPPKPSITSIEITGSSGFRILSSPVSGNIYADLLEELWTQGMAGSDDPDHGSANVWTWSDGNWQSVMDLNNDFYSAGNGILVYVFADADFNGIEDDFPIILSLDSSAHSGELMVSTSANDFNLLGNPYGHSLKISSLLADNDNFYSTIYVWDNAASAYRTHNGLTGDISDGVIAPFQGFWVESKDEGSTFSFNESSISSLRGVNYRTVIDSTGSSSITFTNGESTNSLHFSFNLNGQIDHDDADAYRLLPLNKKDHIASMFYNGSKALSIKNLPYDFNADLGIDLDVLMLEKSDVGFETIDEEISMTWDFSAMPQGISVILRDNLTNQFLNMNEASHHEITTQSKGGFETDLNQVLTYPLLGQSRFTIYLSGATAFSGQDHLIPKEFALHPAYPNPFNPSTSIDYDIHEAGLVTLRIYDMLGREVEELINKVILPGKYSTKWNTSDKISSGVYLVRITNGEKVFNQKITLIK